MPELLSGPLFSIILVILAGIALRYALWYGGNEDDSKASAPASTRKTSVTAPSEATAELRSQLDESQASHRELQGKYQQLVDDYGAFKEATEQQQHDWRAQQREFRERETAVHGQEILIAELRSSQAGAFEELEGERRQREDAESQLQALAGEMNQMRHEIDQLVDERTQQDEHLQRMQQAQDSAVSADQVRGEYEDQLAVLREKIQEGEAAYSQLCSEFDQQREKLARQEQIISDQQQTTERRENVVKHQEETIEVHVETIAQLQSTITEHLQTIDQQEKTIARLEADLRFADDLRQQHSAAKLSLNETQSRLTELDQEKQSLTDQLEDARERIHHLQSQLSATHEETHRLNAECQQARSFADEQQADANQYAEQYNAQREKIRALRTEKEELLNGLHREQDLRLSFESQLAEAHETLTRLQGEADEARRLRDEQQDMVQELDSTRDRAVRLDEAHNDLTIALGRSERRVSELERKSNLLEHEAVTQESNLKRIGDENAQLTRMIEKEKQARSRTEQTLRVHIETLDRLRVDSESLENLLERQAVVQSSLQQHADRLRTVAAEVDTQGSGDNSLGILSIETARSTPENPSQDPVLGSVYTRAPEHQDDLKRISGIGEVLEETLNRLGVYRYEQIMQWSEQTIAEFSKLLAFKDRIQREDWVTQARRLFHDEDNQAA